MMSRLFLVALVLFGTNSAQAAVHLELDLGIASLSSDLPDTSGFAYRGMASFTSFGLLNVDALMGHTSGDNDNGTVEQETTFFGGGVSVKPLNLFRAGAGLIYQKAENRSSNGANVDKKNGFGYFADLGLYRMFGIWGLSLTYTIQHATDNTASLYTAGVILGL